MAKELSKEEIFNPKPEPIKAWGITIHLYPLSAYKIDQLIQLIWKEAENFAVLIKKAKEDEESEEKPIGLQQIFQNNLKKIMHFIFEEDKQNLTDEIIAQITIPQIEWIIRAIIKTNPLLERGLAFFYPTLLPVLGLKNPFLEEFEPEKKEGEEVPEETKT